MHAPSTTSITRPALIGAALAALFVLGACGDDDSGDAEDAFCDAATSLEGNVTALGEMDVAAEGTDALDDALSEIDVDLSDLRDAGAEVAETELDALEDAVDSLESSVSEAAESPSTDDVSAIVTDVANAISAADAVIATLQETCG